MGCDVQLICGEMNEMKIMGECLMFKGDAPGSYLGNRGEEFSRG